MARKNNLQKDMPAPDLTTKPLSDWCISSHDVHAADNLQCAFKRLEEEIIGGAKTANLTIKVRPNGVAKGLGVKKLVDLGGFRAARLRKDGISYYVICERGEAVILVSRKDNFKGARPVLATEYACYLDD